jgi:antibiotic biosynthesis monooxygenase (ABM) superfamily enzyme
MNQSSPSTSSRPTIQPPSKHALALMIWVAVFPTLTFLNLAIGDLVADLPMVIRTFVLATIAVPVVIYGLMPRLHLLRSRLVMARGR